MKGWKISVLDEIAYINPSERLAKGEPAKKVAMELLQPFSKRVTGFSVEPYNGGMKFRNGDTIIARITPCLENGKTAYIDILENDEVGFGSTEYIVLREKEKISDKQFIYYFSISDEFRDMAILAMTGSSGRQRVEIDVVRNHTFLLPLPNKKPLPRFFPASTTRSTSCTARTRHWKPWPRPCSGNGLWKKRMRGGRL